ncbi:VWA domain-containing protein [Stieleria sp. JC731]|uniref:VWA domain-containing protein n=1 Tax=Pirellulaceae TaxID=2691357 RepID=UPI001E3246FB|nr:VWA domain-containing protein [Stieleria sp. JC731]MCC9599721.1 VWA domain-containing protein [Stieleria sp. JC731]
MIDKNDPRLTAYLLGELDEAGHNEVQKALADDPGLRAYVEELRRTIDAVSSAVSNDAIDDVLTEDQLAAIDEASMVSPNHYETTPSRRLWTRLAVAALALYAVGISWFALQDSSDVSVANMREVTRSTDELQTSSSSEEADTIPMPMAEMPTLAEETVDEQAERPDVMLSQSLQLHDGITENHDGITENTTTVQPTRSVGAGSSGAAGLSASPSGAGSSSVESSNTESIDAGSRKQQSLVPMIADQPGSTFDVMDTASGEQAVENAADEDVASKDDSANDESRFLRSRVAPTDKLRPQAKIATAMTPPEPMADSEPTPEPESAAPATAPAPRSPRPLKAIASDPFGGVEGSAQSDPFTAPMSAESAPAATARATVAPATVVPAASAPTDDDIADSNRSLGGYAGGELAEMESTMSMEAMGGMGGMEGRADPAEPFGMAGGLPQTQDQLSRGIVPSETPRSELNLAMPEDRSGESIERQSRRRLPALSEKEEAGDRLSAEADLDSQESKKAKTWKPATASTNRARLSVGHEDDLLLVARDTYVRIDGFRARVMFDMYYYNDRGRQLEGQFMLRLPEDAALHYFAFGAAELPAPVRPVVTVSRGKGQPIEPVPFDPAEQLISTLREQTRNSGSDLARRATDPGYQAEGKSIFASVKPARIVPKQKAALAYEETVRRRVDPALVEWAGAGIFQTKVFPLLPARLHRIVVGYDVNLSDVDGKKEFALDLPEDEAGGRVEFDIVAAPGTTAELEPEAAPFISGGRAYFRYEDAKPRDYVARLSGVDTALLRHRDQTSGMSYFAMQVKAEVPKQETVSLPGRAVFLLDTSYSDRPGTFATRVELLHAILQQNQDTIKEFSVLTFDVAQHWWKPNYVSNDEATRQQLRDYTSSLVLQGASDISGAFQSAMNPEWNAKGDGPDPALFLLSDGVATWGATDVASIVDPIRQSKSAVYCYVVDGATHDRSTLRSIADASGGAVFEANQQNEIAQVAIAHRNQPWRIKASEGEGADELLVIGGSEAIYPGQTLTIVGRGEVSNSIELSYVRGTETKSQTIAPSITVDSPSAARMYGGVAVERLEPLGANVEDVTTAFARYFRVPGQTCSMVMLESAQDYERFGVQLTPDEDVLVIASSSVDDLVRTFKPQSDQGSPRDQFRSWIDSLQEASLVNVPSALRLALRTLPENSFSFQTQPLQCRGVSRDQFEINLLDELDLESPSFPQVLRFADDVLVSLGTDDAIKTASTLIEIKPSDGEALRSVAFRAIAWKRPDQAAPLLYRLAKARPYQPQCLTLLAKSFADQGKLDEAIVCYELVLSGKWNERWGGAKEVAKIELLAVLSQVDKESKLGGYAKARARQLGLTDESEVELTVTMDWNTDRSDLDLHVTEPNGEKCYYRHKKTRIGGQLFFDTTEGFGPEIYTLPSAPQGAYTIRADFYRQDQNRTNTPTEALITITSLEGGRKSVSRRLLSAGEEIHFER